jgi:hypothetical protein
VDVLKDNILLKSGSLDLTDMAFSIPEISWEKKRGSAANIALAPKGKSYGLNIRARDLSAPNATLTLSPSLAVQELILPRVRTDKSDFTLRYKKAASGQMDVSITGNKLDASMDYMAPGEAGKENTLLADFPAINLKMDLGELVLTPAMPFTSVSASLNCTAARCESANVSAIAGKGQVKASIARPNGVRQFNLSSSNAGDFLRAVDATDRMFGGTLQLAGNYNDGISPPGLSARLIIQKFTMKNSEILGRILSIGSLTGLRNALTGSGIDFQKLSADIYSRGGIITVKDGKASGNALGITVGGTVDTRKSHINVRGAIAPAAMINTVLSNIPLIGKIAGGDAGLIAFNYSVEGPLSDPSVMVNPFSAVTPGFLRNIWGSTNPDDPTEADYQGEKKAAPAAPAEPAPSRRHQRGVGQ